MDEPKARNVIKRILAELSAFKVWVFASLVCAVLNVYLSLHIPSLIGEAVDNILGVGDIKWEQLTAILTQMGIYIAAAAVFLYVMNNINNHITYSLTYSLRKRMFDKVIKLKISDIDSHPHGDYMSRITSDTDAFCDGILMGFTSLFTGGLTIVGIIIFMFMIDYRITLVVVILSPISLFSARFIATKTHGYFMKQAQSRGEVVSLASEMITESDVVRAFNYQDVAIDNFKKLNDKLEDASLHAVFFSSITNPSTRFVNSIIYYAVGLIGAIMAIRGSISVGQLSALLTFATQFSKPFNEISGVVTEMQNAFACAQRIFELIDADECEVISSDETLNRDVEGNIEFKDVAFSYNKDRKLIENLSLHIVDGQKIAIVGPTGAGKSTLINLLMRFYDIDSGDIVIGDKSIYDMGLDELRQSFGMVLQETWLMRDTIKNNLRFAKPDATDEEIIAACKKARAHDFIMRLEKGYDTIVSSDSGKLSQGEKQLLCIARLMVSLPPMLILDEATSSIDVRTELMISDAFSQMMKGRTSFIVAHRLSTIKNADIIMYMQDGTVMEMGSHDELLEKNGKYAALYNTQVSVL